jgi:hypothetical protein
MVLVLKFAVYIQESVEYDGTGLLCLKFPQPVNKKKLKTISGFNILKAVLTISLLCISNIFYDPGLVRAS